jgi:hypothetical protein
MIVGFLSGLLRLTSCLVLVRQETRRGRRKYWAGRVTLPIKYAAISNDITRGANSFRNWILKYDSTLNALRQNHLLLIQPQMCFRDTSVLEDAERAVSNYYRIVYQAEKKIAAEIFNYISSNGSVQIFKR